MHSFFTYSSRDHRDLHSFPTRRSSDLNQARRPTYAKTRANSASIRNEPLASIIAARLENGGRRHQTGFDRRPDPFSALGVSQTGCITGEQQAVIDSPASRTGNEVRVAVPFGIGNVSTDTMSMLEVLYETGARLRHRARSQLTEPDVHVVALAETPAVTAQIGRKVQLGHLTGNAARGMP